MNDLKCSLFQVVLFTAMTSHLIMCVYVFAKRGEAPWALFSCVSAVVGINLLVSECRLIANKYGGQQ